eukprot:TRINITY_DN3084_c0_g2_i1.p1 TRINITY_DN3084_c0_g2~~TRINITY_DN3084_c0_g2_i1.p1  ORF type:complete len:235 (+),score=30.66 TRINITY_DN3084_c0_g2_i1:62-706(+)
MDDVTHIYEIPDDLIQLIALELPLHALAQFARTSKRINAVVGEDNFWKTKCTREGMTLPTAEPNSFKSQYQLFSRQIFAFCEVDSKLHVLQLIGDKEWRQRGPDLDIVLSSFYSPGVVCKRTDRTVWLRTQDSVFYELNVFTMQLDKLDLAALPAEAHRCGSFIIHQDVLYLFGSTDNHRDIFSLDLADCKATLASFRQNWTRDLYRRSADAWR